MYKHFLIYGRLFIFGFFSLFFLFEWIMDVWLYGLYGVDLYFWERKGYHGFGKVRDVTVLRFAWLGLALCAGLHGLAWLCVQGCMAWYGFIWRLHGLSWL